MKNLILSICTGMIIFSTISSCCKEPGPVYCPQNWVEVAGECKCQEDYHRIYYEDIDNCSSVYPFKYYPLDYFDCPCFQEKYFILEKDGLSSFGYEVLQEGVGSSGGVYVGIPIDSPPIAFPDDSLRMRILPMAEPDFMDLDAGNCFQDREVDLSYINLSAKYRDEFMVVYLEYVFQNWEREYCQDTLWKLPRYIE